jgi:RimJ/RimL family protein N-acetyltransferase
MTAAPSPAADLSAWTPARRPDASTLAGARVRLEALDAARHAGELFEALQGPDPDPHLWDHLPYGPFADAAGLRAHLEQQERSGDPRFYAVVDQADGRARGVAALMRTDEANGSIEIGHVWFGPALQRTPQATEAIHLMARHAFGDLGHRRLEWKCDAANARSQAAARRFGFTFEGVFRQHMIVKGRNRDTAWFSMLDGEWPAIDAAFRAWLAPENFDAAGRQRASLAELRGAPAG